MPRNRASIPNDKAALTNLPGELLGMVIEACDVSSLNALSQVSKDLNRLAQPVFEKKAVQRLAFNIEDMVSEMKGQTALIMRSAV